MRSDITRGRAGGVALYISDKLPPPVISSDFPLLPMCEALWVSFPLRSSDTLLLGVIYRSPACNPQDDAALLDAIKNFTGSKQHTHLLIMGDFNAPDVQWTTGVCSGTFSNDLLQLTNQEGCTQHVAEPTRYRNGQLPSLLDLILTNEPHQVDRVEINQPLGKSDHASLEFDYICYWPVRPSSCKILRNFPFEYGWFFSRSHAKLLFYCILTRILLY